jgi:hypothetical protein
MIVRYFPGRVVTRTHHRRPPVWPCRRHRAAVQGRPRAEPVAAPRRSLAEPAVTSTCREHRDPPQDLVKEGEAHVPVSSLSPSCAALSPPPRRRASPAVLGAHRGSQAEPRWACSQPRMPRAPSPPQDFNEEGEKGRGARMGRRGRGGGQTSVERARERRGRGRLLTQNLHLAPSTQQAERSWLKSRARSESVPVNFPETDKG